MVKPWHIIVLAVVLILLFGAKRLPDAARSLGRSLRIIKAETQGLVEDGTEAEATPEPVRQPRPVSAEEERQPVEVAQRVRDN